MSKTTHTPEWPSIRPTPSCNWRQKLRSAETQKEASPSPDGARPPIESRPAVPVWGLTECHTLSALRDNSWFAVRNSEDPADQEQQQCACGPKDEDAARKAARLCCCQRSLHRMRTQTADGPGKLFANLLQRRRAGVARPRSGSARTPVGHHRPHANEEREIDHFSRAN